MLSDKLVEIMEAIWCAAEKNLNTTDAIQKNCTVGFDTKDIDDLEQRGLITKDNDTIVFTKKGNTEAEGIMRRALNRQWSDELTLLYGTLQSGDRTEMLRQAEKWLQQRPEDPVLLLTAGRLCVRNELWGKARSYFESSIAIRPSPETWHELGQLLVRMGEDEAASAAFQKGLTQTYGGAAGVPKLGSNVAD